MNEVLWYQPPDGRWVWSTGRVTIHKGMFVCLTKTVTNATGIQTYYKEIWISQNSVAVLKIASRQRHCLPVSGSICFKGIMFPHNCVWAERCTGNTLHGRPLTCWDRGFESHRGHGYLSVVSVVCCQVEVSATSWSLIQRSFTDCGASLCVI